MLHSREDINTYQMLSPSSLLEKVLAAVAEQHFHTVLGTLRQQYQKPLNLN